MLLVTVEDIVYNPGAAHMVDSSASDNSGSPRRLQVKRRRRAAVPSSPSPATRSEGL